MAKSLAKRQKGTNLFKKIVDVENIYNAYRKSLKGKNKYSRESMEFRNDETYNIAKLIESLRDKTYKFSGYMNFIVTEPKERIIDAPHFKDKVVQLAINNVLKEVYYPNFIYDSYACIDGKGTHKCVDRVQEFLRLGKRNYGGDAYIIKVDVKKFFYSIDRDILKSIIRKRIYCKDTLILLFKIIDSANSISEKGLPLGNTISQLCANIYLNELDQYCKRSMSIKYYLRYMDDVVCVVENKSEAIMVLEHIQNFLNDRLSLQVNTKKTKIFPISQGINTVGFKIHTTHRLLRNDCKKKIKRKIKAMPKLMQLNRITKEKAMQILNSWLGHAKHGCSYNFIISLLSRFKYLYLRGSKLCIDYG